MVAEDNIVNQRVISGMLKNCGYEADIAGNGLEAVELFSEKDYALILMDCGMPEMDGFEATKEIRKKEKELEKDAVTIVALTAHALDEVRGRCEAAGMNDFLTKPLQLDIIRNLLERLLPKDCQKVIK